MVAQWSLMICAVSLFGIPPAVHETLAQVYRSNINEVPETDCHRRLGVSRPGIRGPVYWLYASDGWAQKARLYNDEAWVSNLPLYVGDEQPYYSWIQVDLQQSMVITGILTQGDPNVDSWVETYNMWTSEDCENFSPILNKFGSKTIFNGNYNRNHVVTTLFDDVIVSRCIRLVPTSIHGDHIAMRFEMMGCDVGFCKESVVYHLDYEITNISISHNLTFEEYPSSDNTQPTINTRSYIEFKFDVEHIIFGIVVYSNGPRNDKVIVTFSRNCHKWRPVREKQGYGDPVVFRFKTVKYNTQLINLGYPIRAQCLRFIPIRPASTEWGVKAHFLGCGTGRGIVRQCGTQKVMHNRIKRVVGGRPADVGWWPWLASLQIALPGESDYRHACGASIIHPMYIITAAHCIHVMYSMVEDKFAEDYTLWDNHKLKDAIRIQVGDNGGSVSHTTRLFAQVSSIMAHPYYDASEYLYDVAILELKRPLRLSDHVNTVCLPDGQFNITEDLHPCEVVGWGQTGQSKTIRPHHARIPIVSETQCKEVYGNETITDDMLCAARSDGSADACAGDSGAPFICEYAGQWFQVGIVSWNMGCAIAGYPTVYAKVSEFMPWIRHVIMGHPMPTTTPVPTTAEPTNYTTETLNDNSTYYTADGIYNDFQLDNKTDLSSMANEPYKNTTDSIFSTDTLNSTQFDWLNITESPLP